MKLITMIVAAAAGLIVSVSAGWCGDTAEGPAKIAAGLAKSAANGPQRVLVMLEVPENGGTRYTENIRQTAGTVLSGIKGNVRTVRKYDHLPFVALEADADALTSLGEMSRVRVVVPDRLRRLPDIQKPAAVSAPLLYPPNADRIGAGQAWNAGYTGAGWFIAILDSGILTTHELFAGKNIIEACFSSISDCPNGQITMLGAGAAKPFSSTFSGYQHGTHVAGIAAGNSGSRFGVGKDASIIAIQVFSSFTKASDCSPDIPPCIRSFDSDQLAALDYVLSLQGTYPIAAVNMSLGGNIFLSQSACDTSEPIYKSAIDTLRAAGVATVIASGNDGTCNSIEFPACLSSAISVGAVDDTDTEDFFNDWHYSMLKLLAPGMQIYSAIPDSTTSYALLSGTSMSAPHVAGAWAILKQQRPTASVSDILSALEDTGVTVSTSCTSISDHKPRIQIDAALFPPLIPVPSSPVSFSYPSTASPVMNFSKAMPVGVGPIAGNSNVLNLQVGFSQFAGPVDIYFAIYGKPVDPLNLYLFAPGNTLQPLVSGPVQWKNSVVGPFAESLYGELSAAALPRGDYNLYLAVTPSGRLDAYYLWATDFTVH